MEMKNDISVVRWTLKHTWWGFLGDGDRSS